MTLPYAAVLTKPEVPVVNVAHQSSRRFPDTFHDRHTHPVKAPVGRPFWGWREFSAVQGKPDGFVGGDLNPGAVVFDDAGNIDRHASLMSAWEAPFIPESRYFKPDYRRQRLSLDYVMMKRDDTEFELHYYEAAARIAANRRSSNVVYRGPGQGTMPDFEVTSVVGLPPRSPKVADALMANDAWILGFSTDVNVELAKLLGMNELGLPVRHSYLFAQVATQTPTSTILTPEQVLSAVSATDLDRLIGEMVERRLAEREAQAAAKAAIAPRRGRPPRTKPAAPPAAVVAAATEVAE